MCVVSMIGDSYKDRYPNLYPWATQPVTYTTTSPTREEFDALRREVELMHTLLVAGKAYDAANGEPDCEQDEKVELLRRVAELVGVDLSDVFPE